ncbi:MAG: hypothetical protein R2705_04200 [Ilumatobacteraceae bacterium]
MSTTTHEVGPTRASARPICVRSGEDAKLTQLIAGTHYAQATQLDMEYDPAPPLDAGHPRSAPPDVTAWLREMYDQMLGPQN